MAEKIRIGALISGSGTNLQAIIDACGTGEINGEIAFVGSDNPEAGGLERARRHGIPAFVVDYGSAIRRFKEAPEKIVLPEDFDFDDVFSKHSLFPAHTDVEKVKSFLITRAISEAKLLKEMRSYPFDLLILAGFMRNLTPYFIDRVNTACGRPGIMNIHPSLLPAFPGVDGYGDTYRYGCKVGGCTVHFVDYGEDTGPIIGQRSYEIHEEDTVETIKEKGLKLEWALYVGCVKLFSENRLKKVKMSYPLKGGTTFDRTIVRIMPP